MGANAPHPVSETKPTKNRYGVEGGKVGPKAPSKSPKSKVLPAASKKPAPSHEAVRQKSVGTKNYQLANKLSNLKRDRELIAADKNNGGVVKRSQVDAVQKTLDRRARKGKSSSVSAKFNIDSMNRATDSTGGSNISKTKFTGDSTKGGTMKPAASSKKAKPPAKPKKTKSSSNARTSAKRAKVAMPDKVGQVKSKQAISNFLR
jgi:hypothetical protein